VAAVRDGLIEKKRKRRNFMGKAWLPSYPKPWGNNPGNGPKSGQRVQMQMSIM